MMSLVSPSSHFSKYSHPPLSPYLGQLRQPCRRLLIELEALLILLILLCAYYLQYCYVLMFFTSNWLDKIQATVHSE